MAGRPRTTRRGVLVGLGAAITGGVVAPLAGQDTLATDSWRDSDSNEGPPRVASLSAPSDVVTESDKNTLDPLVTYNNRTGPYDITMPVNLRFDLAGSRYAVSDIHTAVGTRDGWTQFVSILGTYWPTSDAKPPSVWDREMSSLIPPVGNYRKPLDPLSGRLGYHLYLWPIQFEGELVGVAAQVHTDIGTVTDHVGTKFDEAAEAVSSVFTAAGWRVIEADFDYGVGPGYLDFWGPTGDRVILPPQS